MKYYQLMIAYALSATGQIFSAKKEKLFERNANIHENTNNNKLKHQNGQSLPGSKHQKNILLLWQKQCILATDGEASL